MRYRPVSSASAVRAAPVARFSTVTLAPTTARPCGSSTWPDKSAVFTCARAAPPLISTSPTARTSRRIRGSVFLSSGPPRRRSLITFSQGLGYWFFAYRESLARRALRRVASSMIAARTLRSVSGTLPWRRIASRQSAVSASQSWNLLQAGF